MQGHCLCGEVAFEFDGPMTGIELCHCSRCQRATGSAFDAGFYVRTDRFRWLRGEHLISFYDAPILRNPPAYRHSFCRTCGSPLPTLYENQPHIQIPTGLVQETLPSTASDHIFTAMKASWWNAEVTSLPSHPGGPPPEFRARMLHVLSQPSE